MNVLDSAVVQILEEEGYHINEKEYSFDAKFAYSKELAKLNNSKKLTLLSLVKRQKDWFLFQLLIKESKGFIIPEHIKIDLFEEKEIASIEEIVDLTNRAISRTNFFVELFKICDRAKFHFIPYYPAFACTECDQKLIVYSQDFRFYLFKSEWREFVWINHEILDLHKYIESHECSDKTIQYYD